MRGRERNSGLVGGEGKGSTLLSQGANRDQVDRSIRCMQTIFKYKDDSTRTRGNTKTHGTSGKSGQKTTVGSLNLSSLGRVISPENISFTKDMVHATRIQDRVVRETSR